MRMPQTGRLCTAGGRWKLVGQPLFRRCSAAFSSAGRCSNPCSSRQETVSVIITPATVPRI
jgi:hypothetical protein